MAFSIIVCQFSSPLLVLSFMSLGCSWFLGLGFHHLLHPCGIVSNFTCVFCFTIVYTVCPQSVPPEALMSYLGKKVDRQSLRFDKFQECLEKLVTLWFAGFVFTVVICIVLTNFYFNLYPKCCICIYHGLYVFFANICINQYLKCCLYIYCGLYYGVLLISVLICI